MKNTIIVYDEHGKEFVFDCVEVAFKSRSSKSVLARYETIISLLHTELPSEGLMKN